MKTIEVENITRISGNEQASTHTFTTVSRSGFILASRAKGTVSGNHYHEGESASKNPEILLLTQGRVQLEGKLLAGEQVFNQELEAPVLVRIYPKVIHTLTALTDIQFLEFNSLEEHKSDTLYPKQG